MTDNLPAIVSLTDMERMAVAVAKGNLFGFKTPEQVLSIMFVAQAENMHPMSAVMEFYLINGRPTRMTWAILARFQRAGGKIEWSERSDKRAAATFSHPQGGSLEVEWTLERARQAALAGKENWVRFPRQMLSARVAAEGVRAIFPAALGGFLVPEEAQDIDEAPRDVTPPAPKRADFTTPTPTPAKEVYDVETGEVAPETEPTAEQKAEWEKIASCEAWGNEAIRRIEASSDAAKIDAWIARHQPKLAEVHALAPDVSVAVVASAEARKKQLGVAA
jgi:hypothetical protein